MGENRLPFGLRLSPCTESKRRYNRAPLNQCRLRGIHYGKRTWRLCFSPIASPLELRSPCFVQCFNALRLSREPNRYGASNGLLPDSSCLLLGRYALTRSPLRSCGALIQETYHHDNRLRIAAVRRSLCPMLNPFREESSARKCLAPERDALLGESRVAALPMEIAYQGLDCVALICRTLCPLASICRHRGIRARAVKNISPKHLHNRTTRQAH